MGQAKMAAAVENTTGFAQGLVPRPHTFTVPRALLVAAEMVTAINLTSIAVSRRDQWGREGKLCSTATQLDVKRRGVPSALASPPKGTSSNVPPEF